MAFKSRDVARYTRGEVIYAAFIGVIIGGLVTTLIAVNMI